MSRWRDFRGKPAMNSHLAYLGLGSNLQEPQAQLCRACDEIAALAEVHSLRRSSLYRTAPLGYAEQPDFINAVVAIRTSLAPQALLQALHGIEEAHRRVREFRNGPRTLDLDILIYDDLQCSDAVLVLPHPRAHLRAFVLYPLLEIAPDCQIPGLGPARDWLSRCTDQAISRIPPEPL